MTQQPRTPTTPAGRALADDFHNGREGAYTEDEYAERLAAIEAEARADLLAQIEKAVRDVPLLKVSGEALSETLAETTGVVGAEQFFCDWDEEEWFIPQDMVLAVLAAIRSAAPVEPSE